VVLSATGYGNYECEKHFQSRFKSLKRQVKNSSWECIPNCRSGAVNSLFRKFSVKLNGQASRNITT